ncbi:MAG: LysM peptidoglycan-binding domain-containing protein [Treponema sp.]|jgi:nucleoid-associated protein YgaU|nr:LysM peptidoglycan-binding domain-containing protein [Treponema sp.]
MASTIGIKIANGDFYSILEEKSIVKKRLVLTTVHDDQESVHIALYRSNTATIQNALYIGTLVVEHIKAKSHGEASIELIVSSNEEGEVIADARDLDAEGMTQHLQVSLTDSRIEEENPRKHADITIEEDAPPPSALYETAPSQKKTPWLIPVILAFVLIIVLFLLWFFVFRGKKTPAEAPVEQNTTTLPVEIAPPPPPVEAPPEKTPPQAAPVEETPSQEALPEETPQETAANEAPGEETGIGGGAPLAETPAAEALPEETPQETAAAEAPSEETGVGGGAPLAETLVEGTPPEAASAEPAPAALAEEAETEPPVIAAPVEAPPPTEALPRDRRNPPVASYKVPTSIPRSGASYRIRWGDTLWDISEAFYRNPWLFPRIARFNNIRNPDIIISGSTIRVPPRN